MLIHDLTIKNFGIISHPMRLQPLPGINLISGINGSGKSTVYKAILLLLFNKTEKKLEEYVNENIPLKEGFQLTMRFELFDELYYTTYSFSKKGKTGVSSRELYVGNPLPDKPQYVNSDVTKVLGELLSESLGLAGLISRQGENDVISAKPSERREHLKEVYDLEFDEEVAAIEADLAIYDDDRIPKVEQQIHTLEHAEYVEEDLLDLPFDENQHEAYEKRLSDLSEQIETVKAKIADRSRRERELDSKKSMLYKVNSEIRETSEYLNQVRDDLHEVESELDSPDRSALEELQHKLDDRSTYREKRERIESELSQIRLFRLRRFDYEAHEKLREKLADSMAEVKQLRERAKLSEEGMCPVCGRPFDEHDDQAIQRELEQEEERLASIKSDVEQSDDRKAEYESAKEELEQKKRSKERLQEKLDQLDEREEEQLQGLREAIQREEQYLEEVKQRQEKRIHELQVQQDRYQKRLSDLKAENKELDEEIGEVESELQEEVAYEVEDMVEEKEQIERSLKEYLAIQAKNEIIKSNNEKTREKKCQKADELSDLYAQRDKLYFERGAYEEAKNILRREFPSYVVSEMVSTLQAGIEAFISKVYYKPLDISISETRNAISITYGKNRAKDVIHLSGAEKQLVSLAYKNHLNRMMGLGLIMLDEADAHYTDENAERLYDIIGNMSEYYNQVFVISHNEQAKAKLTGEYEATYFEFADGKLIA